VAWYETSAAAVLGVRYPLLQAPMSGVSTPELAAAVSNAGGLGSLGAAWLPPDELRAEIRALRALTERPFMVNLFAWPQPDPEPAAHPDLREQLAVVAEERVPVFGFTFGIPDFAAIQSTGAVVVGTATTVGEARVLEAAGVDLVVAQGWEAGGHRGTFEQPVDRVEVGGFALVPQVVDAVSVPVLAAGAIMDGRGIAAALALGAAGASLGTAFIATPESAAHPLYRRVLAQTSAEGTRVSRVFSGREARLVRTDAVEHLVRSGPGPEPYPLQLALTRPLHQAALESGDSERLFLLAGQGSALARELHAAELVAKLVAETDAAVARLGG
jgi:nitronate monooxygenase